MTDKDREAFEATCQNCEVDTRHHHEYPEQYQLYETQLRWMGWQAARDHYAPELTEKEAIDVAAKAICESRTRNHSFDGLVQGLPGSSKLVKYRDYAKAALRAAGVEFRDEA